MARNTDESMSGYFDGVNDVELVQDLKGEVPV
jgi:hypothetical protein